MINRLRKRNLILRFAPFLADLNESLSLAKSFYSWRKNGLPVPAPHGVKRALLLREAQRIGATTFVETGTFTGDTVWFMHDRFRQIFSIEVQHELAAIAAERFRSYPHIEIVEGDSAEMISTLLPKVTGTTLFWLDGHYSAGVTGRGKKDCPIYEELQSIAENPPSKFSIVIDDLRCFGTDDAYPSFEEVGEYLAKNFPQLVVETELDMIWCRG